MSLQSEESRQVALIEPSPDVARDKINQEVLTQGAITGLEKAVIQFTKVTEYTTFQSEYAIVEGDIVIHFFLPPELEGVASAEAYWLNKFPKVLDQVARDYFQSDYPRLMAKYTEELKSWWFKAQGYGLNLDPETFVLRFFETLDRELEK